MAKQYYVDISIPYFSDWSVAGSDLREIKLPRMIGMLFTGIVLGPYVLDLLDSSISKAAVT